MRAVKASREPGEDDEGPPRVYGKSLVSFLGNEDEEPKDDWIVDGLIAAGMANLLVGQPKSFKSFFMLYLAICVASGRPALGTFHVSRRRVLVIEREDPKRTVRRRLRAIARGMGVDLASLDGWLSVSTDDLFWFDDEDKVDQLRREILDLRVGVVFVDSLRATHRGDENSSRDMEAVASAWSSLCTEDTAVVALHHTRKPPSQGTDEADAGSQIRGSSALHAFVRHFLSFVSDKKAKITKVGTGGNLIEREPFGFTMEDGVDASGRQTIVFGHVKDPGAHDELVLDQRILELLARQGSSTTTEIIDAIGGKHQTVRLALTRLSKGAAPKIERMLGGHKPWRLIKETP